MESKKFNPYDWIQGKTNLVPTIATEKVLLPMHNDIEVIVSRIEDYRLDLTVNYQDWLSIGFALADEIGEPGRGFFHRLSKFHPSYDYNECDKQFDKCLVRQQRGISIKTFFFMAQSAGIDIRVPKHY